MDNATATAAPAAAAPVAEKPKVVRRTLPPIMPEADYKALEVEDLVLARESGKVYQITGTAADAGGVKGKEYADGKQVGPTRPLSNKGLSVYVEPIDNTTSTSAAPAAAAAPAAIEGQLIAAAAQVAQKVLTEPEMTDSKMADATVKGQTAAPHPQTTTPEKIAASIPADKPQAKAKAPKRTKAKASDTIDTEDTLATPGAAEAIANITKADVAKATTETPAPVATEKPLKLDGPMKQVPMNTDTDKPAIMQQRAAAPPAPADAPVPAPVQKKLDKEQEKLDAAPSRDPESKAIFNLQETDRYELLPLKMAANRNFNRKTKGQTTRWVEVLKKDVPSGTEVIEPNFYSAEERKELEKQGREREREADAKQAQRASEKAAAAAQTKAKVPNDDTEEGGDEPMQVRRTGGARRELYKGVGMTALLRYGGSKGLNKHQNAWVAEKLGFDPRPNTLAIQTGWGKQGQNLPKIEGELKTELEALHAQAKAAIGYKPAKKTAKPKGGTPEEEGAKAARDIVAADKAAASKRQRLDEEGVVPAKKATPRAKLED
jgi:hypothetical protein